MRVFTILLWTVLIALFVGLNSANVKAENSYDFTSVEKSISKLKSQVNSALKSFAQLSGDHHLVNQMKVEYGSFRGKNLLATCVPHGRTMNLSIERLIDQSFELVAFTVFHELGHCLYGVYHVEEKHHTMSSMYSSKIISQGPDRWVSDIKSLVK